MKILFILFFTFCKIALLSIGGAYSFLPLIEDEVVKKYEWLTKEEFIEVFGVTGILPGAISIKFATYVGYKVAGTPGIIFANLGNLLPTVLLVLIVTLLYKKYKELPGIKGAVDMIKVAFFSLLIVMAFRLVEIKNLASVKNIFFLLFFFAFLVFGKVPPALVIIGAGIIGAVLK